MEGVRGLGLPTEVVSLPTNWSPTKAYSCLHNRRGEGALASAPPSPNAPPPLAPAVPPPQSEKDARQQKARRRHQGEAAEGEEGNATLDLLLKHLDAILATYV